MGRLRTTRECLDPSRVAAAANVGLDDTLSEEQQKAYVRAYAVENPRLSDPQALIITLTHPPFQGIALTPHLLSLACWVAAKRGAAHFPKTRGDLYQALVHELLHMTPAAFPIPEYEPDACLRPGKLHRVAECLALMLLLRRPHQPTLDESELGTAIQQCLLNLGHEQSDVAHLASRLVRGFAENSFLLRRDPRLGYRFLHPSIGEFLAASVLARQIEQSGSGWNAKTPAGDSELTVRQLLDRNAWHPAWRGVITLLAERLTNPAPLLRLLLATDCSERHTLAPFCRPGLALTAMALPEIRESRRNDHHDLADGIIRHLCDVWCEHAERDTLAAAPGVAQAFQRNGAEVRVLESLERLLRDGDHNSRTQAVMAIEAIGPTAASRKIVDLLLGELSRGDGVFRQRVCDALNALGPRAATPELLQNLLERTELRKVTARCEAATAIGVLGRYAPTTQILDCLLNLLRDGDSSLRSSAAEAIGHLGTAAVTPPLIEKLLELSRQQDAAFRLAAVEAMGWLGESVSSPQILNRLVELLRDEDSGVQSEAAYAIGKIAGATIAPSMLQFLTKLCQRNEKWWVGLEAIGALGPRAASPQVLACLLELFQAVPPEVTWEIVGAIGRLGRVAASPEVLNRLVELTRDEDSCVRSSAADAIGSLGEGVVTIEVVDRLLELTRDEDSYVRSSAAHAIGGLGEAKWIARVLDRLLELTRDEDGRVRSSAADAIGSSGEGVVTLEVVDRLLELTRDEDSDVRSSAAHAIGRSRAGVVTLKVLNRLLALTRDGKTDVRSGAADAIGRLWAYLPLQNNEDDFGDADLRQHGDRDADQVDDGAQPGDQHE